MTETDLFTAEGGTGQASLPTAQSAPENPSQVAAEASTTSGDVAAPTESAPVAAPDNGAATTTPEPSLSAMVLPELRALANRVGKFWHMANYILRNGQRDYPESVRAVGNRERAGIVGAIERRDAEAAERAMEQHVLGKPRRVGLL